MLIRHFLTRTVPFLLSGLAHASPTTDAPVDSLMVLLRRISPAAEEGATAYLEAHLHRCGVPLGESALRRALADGQGDRVLMQMIRAAHDRDRSALAQLARQVTCRRSTER